MKGKRWTKREENMYYLKHYGIILFYLVTLAIFIYANI